MRLSTDAKIGALLFLLCIVMFVASFWIQQPEYANMSAAVFPRVVLIVLAPLCLVLFFRGLRLPASRPVTLRAVWETVVRYRTVLISFVLFFVLVALMPILGFLITGTLYLMAMLWLLGPRTPAQIPLVLLISVGFAGGIYLIFVYVLHVIIPSGIYF